MHVVLDLHWNLGYFNTIRQVANLFKKTRLSSKYKPINMKPDHLLFNIHKPFTGAGISVYYCTLRQTLTHVPTHIVLLNKLSACLGHRYTSLSVMLVLSLMSFETAWKRWSSNINWKMISMLYNVPMNMYVLNVCPWFSAGQVTTAVDIYSFGMCALEVGVGTAEVTVATCLTRGWE